MSGILNTPDESYNPATDPSLAERYGPEDFSSGKAANKIVLQHRLGLTVNATAPILFWPSRLDPQQKGPQLFTDILEHTLADYRNSGLQVVVVTDQ